MNRNDAEALMGGLKKILEAVAERLKGNDVEIAELKTEIERLKREPRKTVAQRVRERGVQ